MLQATETNCIQLVTAGGTDSIFLTTGCECRVQGGQNMRIVTSILLTASVLAIWCQPASAQTSLGYSSYTAKVQANGSVTDSNGVQSTAKNGVGLYTVTFSRPLIDCVFLGTITSNNPGMISVIRINTNSVRVSTFSSGGAPRDSAFVVLVSCAS